MYAKYTYLANITQAQLLSDIVAILTGTTNVASLSAGCDQANTTISTAYDPAGWTLHDSAAGTNAQVIKAPCVGAPTTYKYVEINTNTAGQLFTALWEGWNAGTHVGTNVTTNSKGTGYGQRYATTTTGTLYISASSGRILVYGVSSAGNGHANGVNSISGVLEHDTGYDWCAPGQGFMPAMFFHSGYMLYHPRFKDLTGVTQTGTANGSYLCTMGVATYGGYTMAKGSGNGMPMASGFCLPIAPFAALPNSVNSCVASGFSASNIYALLGYANALDETSYAGKTWVAMPTSTSSTTEIKVLVPKG